MFKLSLFSIRSNTSIVLLSKSFFHTLSKNVGSPSSNSRVNLPQSSSGMSPGVCPGGAPHCGFLLKSFSHFVLEFGIVVFFSFFIVFFNYVVCLCYFFKLNSLLARLYFYQDDILKLISYMLL